MFNPVSTYRIQFNKEFTFKNLNAILPFLQKLGVRTIYASPIFSAVPGSMHGYDVVDSYEINPEIGTEADLYALNKKLQDAGMYWIQDIVPNHMAFHQGNLWLMDVLEKGNLSNYASFFDITWSNELFHGRLMVPFLGETLDEVIGKKELKVVYEQDRLVLRYFDSFYPLHSNSYQFILSTCENAPPAVRQWLEQRSYQSQIEEPVSYALAWHELMLQFSVLMRESLSAQYINECVSIVNEDRALLQKLADMQVYRLCSWQETDKQINFRRFFTVNGLICLNMQSKQVFDHYHKKIKKFIADGVFQGLRVDHIDGLYDPEQYIGRLRELVGDEVYIVVEKILEPGESLPNSWPVQGTTGYDFLALVNNLFTRNNAEGSFSKLYNSFLRDKRTIREKIEEKKAMILREHMGGELDNLYHLLLELNLIDSSNLNNLTPGELKSSIAELLIVCPVYRFYGNEFPLTQIEQEDVKAVLKNCKNRKPALRNVFEVLENIFIQKTEEGNVDYNQRAIQFYQRCMQFTGPLMAKGVEDTLMYSFNRFIGHNEVGDSPEFFGLTTNDFHRHMQDRQEQWPLTINTTATHDTKRGEGVRMRLNVLPALVDEWAEMVKHWRILNEGITTGDVPTANDEYFIYQTLVGTFPLAVHELDEYKERLSEYLKKSLREAKQNSGWSSPNELYEEKTIAFATGLLDPKTAFWNSFSAFQKKVSDFGMINSMAQVLLKFTCPGVPDLYQGTTSWDLTMVDPDNRRPVDFELRQQNLTEILSNSKDKQELIKELWETRENAKIKLWLVNKLLSERNKNSQVFTEGFYEPLQVEGKYKDNIVAFARRFQNEWYVVVIPLYLAQLCKDQEAEITDVDWSDTYVTVPAQFPLEYENVLLDNKARHNSKLLIKDIFSVLPLALLKLKQENKKRAAGILLPIASLPSNFAIGDFGLEAKRFVKFLERSGQMLWQILPLNPTTAGGGYSPYSSHSGMALNTLYISIEQLAHDGLIDKGELNKLALSSLNKIDYLKAEEVKNKYFDNAWEKFNLRPNALQKRFEQFLKNESYWLDDFSLYEVLKARFQNKPWYEWPGDFKNRNSVAIENFSKENYKDILKVKWLQFIVAKQWHDLRVYCNLLGIKILGDLPFYVSYNSADVWANRELFSVNEDGTLQGVAGVPPDYFDSNGQLWGMPTFRWDVLKNQNYTWWINRIKRNIELYNVLRFDHFRAFVNYWEVPAEEKTAINGNWKKGPGADFFTVLQETLGDLPFIAEDLGDVNEDVFALRDKFKLPGMKILHFAFGEDMPQSMYTPHNYTSNFIVYTGTHDNNTTRGWYKNDLNKEDHKRLEVYFSKKIKESNVAEEMIRLAYSSIAKISITPIQDVLNLDEKSRINKPSSLQDNWQWRLKPSQLTLEHEKKLMNLVKIFGR